MPKKLPGVLLLVLSALGFIVSGLFAAIIVFSLAKSQPAAALQADSLPLASTGALAAFVGLLQVPTFMIALKSLRGKTTGVAHPSLLKPALLAGAVWAAAIAVASFAAQVQAPWPIFVPLTLLAVSIPVWLLVEISRNGLPRSSALREWGTLTIGLTIAPLLIMLIEIFMVAVITIAVLISLGTQPGFLEQVGVIVQNFDLYQGGIDQLEQLMGELAQNPLIAAALFLAIGVIAPFIEELFKPMAIWFLLKRPLKSWEGFSLGLISGGAFALLESAGLVSQIGIEVWAQAVILRAATGLLHIGLSGLVGYGLALSWNQNRFGRAAFYLLGAASLHGAWNSLALLSGFSTTTIPAAGAADFRASFTNFLPIAGMLAIFAAVLFLVLRVNRKLRIFAEIDIHPPIELPQAEPDK